jgi:hypothetical protein
MTLLPDRDDRDLIIPEFGVHERDRLPVAELVANLEANGWPVFVLGGAPETETEFFDAVYASLPHAWPVPNRGWDALSDNLWQGIHDLKIGRLAIVWPDSRRLQRDPDAYAIAREVFTDLVFSLADLKFAVDHETRLLVLLA